METGLTTYRQFNTTWLFNLAMVIGFLSVSGCSKSPAARYVHPATMCCQYRQGYPLSKHTVVYQKTVPAAAAILTGSNTRNYTAAPGAFSRQVAVQIAVVSVIYKTTKKALRLLQPIFSLAEPGRLLPS